MKQRPEAPKLGPQSGPQEAFLKTTADIAIYGGAAGSGKTFAELLEPLYHVGTKNFVAAIFRRESTQITNPGGLWDAAMKVYPLIGARPVQSPQMRYIFPSGAYVMLGHLNAESTVLNFQGAEIPLIMFDELTHFSQAQFFYMLSRNRSTDMPEGFRPYVRATTNPDADSWVARFIAWWIDEKTGTFIPERSGVIRWFVRIDDTIIWADSREELYAAHGNPDLAWDDDEQIQPKSVTFIGATIFDNRILMRKDPGYLANLRALPVVERERLLGGNWKIRASAGLLFQRRWVNYLEHEPPTGVEWVRHWDLAATVVDEGKGTDPDWTVGIKMGRQQVGKTEDGKPLYRFIVADRVKFRGRPLDVERALASTASKDGNRCRVSLPQDPGQAGKSQAMRLVAMLAGYNAHSAPESGDKEVRFGPFSAQAEAGNVYVVRGQWNEDWFDCLEGFPDALHDDDADATSGAFNDLLGKRPTTISGQMVVSTARYGLPA